MEKLGFIGMGNMGLAIAKGLLKNKFLPDQIIFADADKERCEKISREIQISYVCTNAECARGARYVILAVKPQYYEPVLKEIRPVLGKEQVVISISPGKTREYLNAELGREVRIVRAMPNTPALVGEGMTGVSFDETLFSDEENEMICRFFCSFGKMEKVDEKLMDAVVCASGSSPAYVYMFIEALADGAVKCGLSRKQAYQMAAQTVLGSAKMVLETGLHPGELKDMVCSPGGTTIAGVEALEEYGFRNALMKATDACFERCRTI